jgi:hypothetical protein
MLNAEEVEKEHQELNLKISEILWDFADKHSADNRPNGHQAFFIMQSVLSEYQSNIEYQNGKMAPFTGRQLDHICYQIGDWYLMMRPLLEGQHNLGFMKEKLKTMIWGDE